MHNNPDMDQAISTEQNGIKAKDVREGSVGWMLNKLSSTINFNMKKKLSSLDLTIHQFTIMMTLLEMDHISQTAIGKKVDLPSYAITRNLDALEARGLLERQADKSSRRSFSITLTEEGLALAPSLFQAVDEINTDLLTILTPKENSQLKQILNKLVVVQTCNLA